VAWVVDVLCLPLVELGMFRFLIAHKLGRGGLLLKLPHLELGVINGVEVFIFGWRAVLYAAPLLHVVVNHHRLLLQCWPALRLKEVGSSDIVYLYVVV
jgi:hypothetical protein